jgi:TonB family protein
MIKKAEKIMKTTLLALLTSTLCFPAGWIAAMEQARIAMNRGELVNAEQILTSTIGQAQAKSGRNATALDQPLEMLAQVYQREKRFSDAVNTQQQRLEIWTAVAGENGVMVGRVLQQRSAGELQAGNFPAAESDSRRALAIMTAAYVDKPPAAQAAVDLADVLIAENRRDEAEQVLALAEKTFETSLGPTSLLTTGVIVRRAAILKQLGRAAPRPAAAATVFKVGGTGQNQVAAPRIISKVEPQYAEEARVNKLQGSILLTLVVDPTGMPTQIAVLRPLGMGLDEKAIEAISQWRFTPGQKNGAPVPVYTQVEMTFHLL